MPFTVTGTLRRTDSKPQTGKLIFSATPDRFRVASDTVFGVSTAILDAAGEVKAEDGSAFTLEWAPGLVYHVRYLGSGHYSPFSFEVPASDGGTLDLDTVTPLQVPAGLDPNLYVGSGGVARVVVVTGSEARPTADFVMWVGGFTEPTNMADGDVWFADTGTPPPAATAPTITTTALNALTQSTAFTQTLAATGTTPITWSVTVGALPAGLALASSTGILSGTPTAAGAYSFTVTATNSAGSDTQAYSGTVAAPGGGVGTPEAAWGFESSATPGTDSTGHGHTGTLVGDALWFNVGHGSSGDIYNPGVHADGSGMTVPRTGLEPTTAIGVACWIMHNDRTETYRVAVAKGRAGAGDSYALYTAYGAGKADRATWTITTTAGSFTVGDTGPTLADTGWHFIAGTYDGTTTRFYLGNGTTLTEVSSLAATGTLVYDTTNLGILTSLSFPGESVAAEIDDLRIWTYAPTLSELTAAMQTPVV